MRCESSVISDMTEEDINTARLFIASPNRIILTLYRPYAA